MRKYWIDYLRCLGIFAVLCIHTTSPPYRQFSAISGLNWWIANIINASSRFAVPLFVMISGSVLLGRDISTVTFYKKRFARLFLPFIFWSLFYYVFKICEGSSVKVILHAVIDGRMYYHLWYLSMLMCLMAFVPFINNLIKGKKLAKAEVAMLAGIFFLFFNFSWLSYAFNQTSSLHFDWYKEFPLYIAYLIFGYYLSQDISLLKMKNYMIAIIILALSLLGAVLNYLSCEYMHVLKEHFVLLNTGPLTLIITTLVFFLFSKNKEIFKENKLIIALSDASFGIYLIHPFFLFFIRKALPDSLYSRPWCLLASICSLMLISFSSIHFLRKCRFGQLIC